jgi:hypothetical protein
MNNISINKKTGEVNLVFNRFFYDPSVIKKCIEDFKEVCTASFKEEDKILVTLSPKDQKIIAKLGYEFFNYVLGSMKNKTLC